MLLYLLLLAVPRSGLLGVLFLLVWPTAALIAGDMAGITTRDIVFLVGISVIGNGLVYAVIGMVIHVCTRRLW